MKYIILIIITMVLVYTNPEKSSHINKITNVIVEQNLNNKISSEEILIKNIDIKLNNLIIIDDYVLFSLSKIKINNNYKYISIGFLNNVFILPDIKRKIECQKQE